jgi:hypothetical protein
MARGQKGWQKTTAGTFWFSSFAAGLFVVACLVAGTLDFLLFPKPSSSFVGHFHGSCHDYLACPMTEDWVLAPEVTEISPAVEPVVTSISPGVRICLISPADEGTCVQQVASTPMAEVCVLAPEVTEISPEVEPVVTSISPGVRICLISPADEGTCVPQVASTPTVHGDRGRFNKGNKRVFGALSTTPQTPLSGESRKRPSKSEMLLSSQSGELIRDGALHPTQSRIRDRGEMESGPGPDKTGQAHKSNPATRTLGTEFADMAVVVVTPTEPVAPKSTELSDMDIVVVTPTAPVAPKTRKVRCCKVRFPPPIVNHILISFFML